MECIWGANKLHFSHKCVNFGLRKICIKMLTETGTEMYFLAQ